MKIADGVSIIIPTLNGGEEFRQCLKAIAGQRLMRESQLIIIDSGSEDGSVELARQYGACLIHIPPGDFHHARTRNLAVRNAVFPNIIMSVQDAILENENCIEDMVNALDNYDIVALTGRQMPRSDADLYARFEVDYHNEYLGDKSSIKNISSEKWYSSLSYHEALQLIRFDNVIAAYKQKELINTPFPEVPFGEDMAWAKKIMLQGHSLLYLPSIRVIHSHNRSTDYRFRRAMVDSISSANIVGKTREDLSFLELPDIERINIKIKNELEKLKYEVSSVQGMEYNNNTDKRILFRNFISTHLPISKNLYYKARTMLGKVNYRVWEELYVSTAKARAIFIISQITSRYSGYTNNDLVKAIDHVAASIQGSLFGDVYASHRLKGNIPSELENYVSFQKLGV